MALTFTRRGDVPYRVSGAQKKTITNVTLDDSYTESGESVTAADLGLNTVELAECTIFSTSGGGVNVASAAYAPSTSLLHVYDETPAEVAGAADVSTTVVQVVAYGN